MARRSPGFIPSSITAASSPGSAASSVNSSKNSSSMSRRIMAPPDPCPNRTSVSFTANPFPQHRSYR